MKPDVRYPVIQAIDEDTGKPVRLRIKDGKLEVDAKVSVAVEQNHIEGSPDGGENWVPVKVNAAGEVFITPDEITGEEGGGEGRSIADVNNSVSEINNTIFEAQEDVLSVGFANRSWAVYQPGIVMGSEITIDNDVNQLTITENDNDMFNLILDSNYIDSTESENWIEIQIAADTYESGEFFVQAIMDAIEEAEVSVIWEGEDTGRIIFISNLFGSHYMPRVDDPETVGHSALAVMGYDEIEEIYGDLTLEEIYKLIQDEGTRIAPVNGLIFEERLAYGGENDTVETEDIDPAGNKIIVVVENSTDKELTVTFQHRIDEGIYVDWYNSEGNLMSFTISASGTTGASQAIGPLEGWLKFMGGKLVIKADTNPDAAAEVDVTVQEIA